VAAPRDAGNVYPWWQYESPAEEEERRRHGEALRSAPEGQQPALTPRSPRATPLPIATPPTVGGLATGWAVPKVTPPPIAPRPMPAIAPATTPPIGGTGARPQDEGMSLPVGIPGQPATTPVIVPVRQTPTATRASPAGATGGPRLATTWASPLTGVVPTPRPAPVPGPVAPTVPAPGAIRAPGQYTRPIPTVPIGRQPAYPPLGYSQGVSSFAGQPPREQAEARKTLAQLAEEALYGAPGQQGLIPTIEQWRTGPLRDVVDWSRRNVAQPLAGAAFEALLSGNRPLGGFLPITADQAVRAAIPEEEQARLAAEGILPTKEQQEADLLARAGGVEPGVSLTQDWQRWKNIEATAPLWWRIPVEIAADPANWLGWVGRPLARAGSAAQAASDAPRLASGLSRTSDAIRGLATTQNVGRAMSAVDTAQNIGTWASATKEELPAMIAFAAAVRYGSALGREGNNLLRWYKGTDAPLGDRLAVGLQSEWELGFRQRGEKPPETLSVRTADGEMADVAPSEVFYNAGHELARWLENGYVPKEGTWAEGALRRAQSPEEQMRLARQMWQQEMAGQVQGIPYEQTRTGGAAYRGPLTDEEIGQYLRTGPVIDANAYRQARAAQQAEAMRRGWAPMAEQAPSAAPDMTRLQRWYEDTMTRQGALTNEQQQSAMAYAGGQSVAAPWEQWPDIAPVSSKFDEPQARQWLQNTLDDQGELTPRQAEALYEYQYRGGQAPWEMERLAPRSQVPETPRMATSWAAGAPQGQAEAQAAPTGERVAPAQAAEEPVASGGRGTQRQAVGGGEAAERQVSDATRRSPTQLDEAWQPVPQEEAQRVYERLGAADPTGQYAGTTRDLERIRDAMVEHPDRDRMLDILLNGEGLGRRAYLAEQGWGRTGEVSRATRAQIDAAVKAHGGEDAFQAWARDVANVFAPPMLNLRGQLAPYTLDNVAEAMALHRRSQPITRTSGPGQAGAQQAREASPAEKEQIRAALAAYEQALRPFSTQRARHGGTRANVVADTASRLSNALRALGEYQKGGRGQRSAQRMAQALRRNGFAGFERSDAVERALVAAEALGDMPAALFEAQPQHTVSTAGPSGAATTAVSGENASAAARQALPERGLPTATYGPAPATGGRADIERSSAPGGRESAENIPEQGVSEMANEMAREMAGGVASETAQTTASDSAALGQFDYGLLLPAIAKKGQEVEWLRILSKMADKPEWKERYVAYRALLYPLEQKQIDQGAPFHQNQFELPAESWTKETQIWRIPEGFHADSKVIDYPGELYMAVRAAADGPMPERGIDEWRGGMTPIARDYALTGRLPDWYTKLNRGEKLRLAQALSWAETIAPDDPQAWETSLELQANEGMWQRAHSHPDWWLLGTAERLKEDLADATRRRILSSNPGEASSEPYSHIEKALSLLYPEQQLQVIMYLEDGIPPLLEGVDETLDPPETKERAKPNSFDLLEALDSLDRWQQVLWPAGGKQKKWAESFLRDDLREQLRHVPWLAGDVAHATGNPDFWRRAAYALSDDKKPADLWREMLPERIKNAMESRDGASLVISRPDGPQPRDSSDWARQLRAMFIDELWQMAEPEKHLDKWLANVDSPELFQQLLVRVGVHGDQHDPSAPLVLPVTPLRAHQLRSTILRKWSSVASEQDKEDLLLRLFGMPLSDDPNYVVALGDYLSVTEDVVEKADAVRAQDQERLAQYAAPTEQRREAPLGVHADAAAGYVEGYETVDARQRYAGNMDEIIMRELLQNMVDAVRGPGGGDVSLEVWNDERMFLAKDHGTGMTPEQVVNEYVRIGATLKPEDASGGKGSAKIALLGNADVLFMRTMARDPRTGKWMDTIVWGTGDAYLNKNVGLMRASYPAGEMPQEILAQIPRVMANDSFWRAESGEWRSGTMQAEIARYDVPWGDRDKEWDWLADFQDTQQLPNIQVQLALNGMPVRADRPNRTKWEKLEAIDEGPVQMIVYQSPATKETYMIPVTVLNHGLPQYQTVLYLNDKMEAPNKLVVDVISHTSAQDREDPWTADRRGLTPRYDSAWREYMKTKLKESYEQRERRRLQALLYDDAPEIIPSEGGERVLRLVSEKDIPLPELEEIAGRRYTQALARAAERAHNQLRQLLAGRSPGWLLSTTDSQMWGLGISDRWIGINIRTDALGGGPNRILTNPWIYASGGWKEVMATIGRARDAISPEEQAATRQEFAETLAAHLVDSIYHELCHNRQWNHGSEFASIVGRLQSTLGARNQLALTMEIADELARGFADTSDIDQYVLDTERIVHEVEKAGSGIGAYGSGERTTGVPEVDSGDDGDRGVPAGADRLPGLPPSTGSAPGIQPGAGETGVSGLYEPGANPGIRETGAPVARGTGVPAPGEGRDRLEGAEQRRELVGDETWSYGPEANQRLEHRLKVVELDDLVVSHDLRGQENPAYPQDLQPRDRSRTGSTEWVQGTAPRLDPDRLLFDGHRLDDGPPIVNAQNQVESGNGRVLVVKLAQRDYPQRYDAYRETLMDYAEQYGLDRAAIANMSTPVLVRERLTPLADIQAYVDAANKPQIQQRSEAEQARADARLISQDMLEDLQVSGETDIRQALRQDQNQQVVYDFIQALAPEERNAMVTASGDLSPDGYRRFINALFTRTYRGKPGGALAQLLLESQDAGVQQIEKALLGSLGPMAKAEGLMQEGARDATLSLAANLSRTLRHLQELRKTGVSVDDYLNTRATFVGELNAFDRWLLDLESRMLVSPTRLRDVLVRYAELVQASPDPRQQGLFGAVEIPAKEQLLERAITEVANEREENPGDWLHGEIPADEGVLKQLGQEDANRPDPYPIDRGQWAHNKNWNAHVTLAENRLAFGSLGKRGERQVFDPQAEVSLDEWQMAGDIYEKERLLRAILPGHMRPKAQVLAELAEQIAPQLYTDNAIPGAGAVQIKAVLPEQNLVAMVEGDRIVIGHTVKRKGRRIMRPDVSLTIRQWKELSGAQARQEYVREQIPAAFRGKAQAYEQVGAMLLEKLEQPEVRKAATIEGLRPVGERIAWRVDTGTRLPAGATAADVVQWEQTERHADLNIDERILKPLRDRPATDIVWVTFARENALRYAQPGGGEREPQQWPLAKDARLLASDGQGGYLVVHDSSAAAPEPKPSERLSAAQKQALANAGYDDELLTMLTEDELQTVLRAVETDSEYPLHLDPSMLRSRAGKGTAPEATAPAAAVPPEATPEALKEARQFYYPRDKFGGKGKRSIGKTVHYQGMAITVNRAMLDRLAQDGYTDRQIESMHPEDVVNIYTNAISPERSAELARYGRGKLGVVRADNIPINDDQRLQEAVASEEEERREPPYDGWTRFRMNMTDRLAPLDWLAKEVGSDVYTLARLVPGMAMRGESIVEQYVLPVIRDLSPEELQDLEVYMTGWRMVDLVKINPNVALAGGVKDPRRALAQMIHRIGGEQGSLHPQMVKISRAADQLWEINRDVLLTRARDGGRISYQAWQVLMEKHPHYLPFYREGMPNELDVLANFTSAQVANLDENFIRYLSEMGSEKPVKSPLARWMTMIVKNEVDIARNTTAREMIAALEKWQESLGEQIVFRGDKPMPDSDRVEWWENGERQVAWVPTLYARVAKALDKEPANVLSRAFLLPAQLLRLGTTQLNLPFTVVNTMRDLMTAWYNEGLHPFGEAYWQGWVAALTHNETWREVANAGALGAGIGDTFRSLHDIDQRNRQLTLGVSVRNWQEAGQAGAKLMALARRIAGESEQIVAARRAGDADGARRMTRRLRDDLGLMAGVGPHLIMSLNEVAETATRVAGYQHLKNVRKLEGPELAVRAREITIDFAKAGTWMQLLNRVIPFTNAQEQAAIKTAQVLKRDPARALLASIPFVAASALAFLWNKRYGSSKEIPDYEYLSNWVIMIDEVPLPPDPEYPDEPLQWAPVYLRIPKGPIGSAFTAMPEALMRLAWQQNDRTVAETVARAVLAMVEAVSPVEINATMANPMPILGSTAEVLANRNLFTGQEIVPSSEQENLPRELQYGRETSVVAVGIVTAFDKAVQSLGWQGVSPRQLDYLIRANTGGAGEQLLWLMDIVAGALGYQPEPPGSAYERERLPIEQLTTNPFTKRFVGMRGNESERIAWEDAHKIEQSIQRQYMQNPEVKRLKIGASLPGESISIDGSNRKLSPSQRAWLMQRTAELTIPATDALTASETYAKLDDREKEKALRALRSKLSSYAREEMAAQLTGDDLGDRWQAEEMDELVQGWEEYQVYRQMPTSAIRLSANEQAAVAEAQAAYDRIEREHPGWTAAQVWLEYLQQGGDAEAMGLLRAQQKARNPQRNEYLREHPLVQKYGWTQ